MATITGNIRYATISAAPGVALRFIPQDTPKADASYTAISTEPEFVTDSSGDLPAGITLISGRYTVQVSNGESFEIDVPTGSGTHTLDTLIAATESVDTTSFVRARYQATTQVTVSNQSATNIISSSGVGTLGLPANFFSEGIKIESVVEGTITTTGAAGNLTINLRLTSTILSLTFALPAVTAAPFRVEGAILCIASGASGNLLCQIVARVADSSSNLKTYQTSDEVSIDTTLSKTVQVQAQFSAASQSLTTVFGQVVSLPLYTS